MRLYEDGDFVEREDDRRLVRDIYREKFFAALPVERSQDPFATASGSEVSMADILKLTQQATALHDGDTSGLLLSAQALANFAVTSRVGFASGALDFQDMTVAALGTNHFVYEWRA